MFYKNVCLKGNCMIQNNLSGEKKNILVVISLQKIMLFSANNNINRINKMLTHKHYKIWLINKEYVENLQHAFKEKRARVSLSMRWLSKRLVRKEWSWNLFDIRPCQTYFTWSPLIMSNQSKVLTYKKQLLGNTGRMVYLSKPERVRL